MHGAVLRNADAESLVAQVARQHFPDAGIVVHDENMRLFSHLSCPVHYLHLGKARDRLDRSASWPGGPTRMRCYNSLQVADKFARMSATTVTLASLL